MRRRLDTLDERDQTILAERVDALNVRDRTPHVGDFVRFADDVVRRVSYVWPDGVQSSNGGSYYLGNGYVSMSGSLYPCVPTETLTLTAEGLTGGVWFFHHDHHTADNAVRAEVLFDVWACSVVAPS